MTTQIYGASGHVENLDTMNYRFVNVEGTWDTGESYNPSAQVVLEMEMEMETPETIYWQDVTYTNTCEFNSYGEASFSWS